MEAKPKLPIPIVIFTAVYGALASYSAIRSGNQEFVMYILVMATLIAALFIVHRRCDLSPPLLWCLSVWGLLHMAGGLVQIPKFWPYNGPHSVLYSLWFIPEKLKYDQVVHAYGFGIATWLCWEILRNSIKTIYRKDLRPTLGVVVLCGLAGMGLGAFNEVVEFIATLTMPKTNVGGYINTGWDLVYNMIGATAVASAIHVKGNDGKS